MLGEVDEQSQHLSDRSAKQQWNFTFDEVALDVAKLVIDEDRDFDCPGTYRFVVAIKVEGAIHTMEGQLTLIESKALQVLQVALKWAESQEKCRST